MTKSQILNQLANNAKLKRVAYNIGGDGGDDLFQELFITLGTYDETKLLKSYNEKYLEYLCIKIMSDKQHYIFRETPQTVAIENTTISIDPYEQMETEKAIREYEDLLEPIDNYIEQPVTQDNFFGLTLLKDWIGGESYREISKRTRIPVDSIAKTVQKEIKKIRQECL